MRLLTAFLLVSATALPALAQIAEPPPPSSSTTGTSSGTGITPTPTADTSQKLDDVGYDPKVKRDPYGNAIGEKAKGGTITTIKPPLRSDSAKGLRSDRSLMKAAPSAAPGSAGNTSSQTPVRITPTYTNPTSGDGSVSPTSPPSNPAVNTTAPTP